MTWEKVFEQLAKVDLLYPKHINARCNIIANTKTSSGWKVSGDFTEYPLKEKGVTEVLGIAILRDNMLPKDEVRLTRYAVNGYIDNKGIDINSTVEGIKFVDDFYNKVYGSRIEYIIIGTKKKEREYVEADYSGI